MCDNFWLRGRAAASRAGVGSLALEGGEAWSRRSASRRAGRASRIPARVVLLHQGAVLSNTQISLVAAARSIAGTYAQLCWGARHRRMGSNSTSAGIFMWPRATAVGIGGRRGGGAARPARRAGSCTSAQAGSTGPRAIRPRRAGAREIAREQQSGRSSTPCTGRPTAFRRTTTTVCRCEEVTAGEMRGFVGLGAPGPNQAKRFGRCGMGPCQGRQCGLTVRTEVIASERGVSPAEVGAFRPRAPYKPITLGALAGLATPPDPAPTLPPGA